MIGAWGYDFRSGRLVSKFRKDIMGYCTPRWISDYHFTKAFRHRLSAERTTSRAVPRAPARSLLLWGGVDAEGKPLLHPAFVADAPPALPERAGDYTLIGRDAGGGELFSLSFAMPVMASEEEVGSAFAFVLPVRPEWAGALSSITLSGPDGSVTLDGRSDRPMAILRNPSTGQVRRVPERPVAHRRSRHGCGETGRRIGAGSALQPRDPRRRSLEAVMEHHAGTPGRGAQPDRAVLPEEFRQPSPGGTGSDDTAPHPGSTHRTPTMRISTDVMQEGDGLLGVTIPSAVAAACHGALGHMPAATSNAEAPA